MWSWLVSMVVVLISLTNNYAEAVIDHFEVELFNTRSMTETGDINTFITLKVNTYFFPNIPV